jgi:flagellar basal-body rod modification protein FlgD
MASVTPTSTGSTYTSSISSSRKSIADNFDQFLSLLTTQLQNQNPLDPLDTNQFTQQLVQFSQVEQQIKSNEMLASLADASNANRSASAAGYIGMTITADGARTTLANGKAQWSWDAARSGNATITVTDSTGATVYSKTQSINAGPGSFSWNGQTDNGGLKTSGDYTIKVVAKDSANNPIKVTTEINGIVDGVDLTGSVPVLKIGSTGVALDLVKSLRKPAA